MSKKIILLFLLFAPFINNVFSRNNEVWESNVAIIDEAELFGIMQQSFNINVDDFVVKSSQQAKVENIAFLMRLPDHRSLEEISKKYKHLVTDLNEKYPIQQVKYDSEYSVFNENNPQLTIKIKPANGWGADKNSYTLFRESYLSTGKVTEESMQWVRVTPKKNKSYYEKSLLKSTLTKPTDFEIIQLNPDRWIYSYTYKAFDDNNQVMVKSVIYSEKYGISISFEAPHSSEITDASMLNFGLKMAGKIFNDVDEKGIIPSPKYVYFMHEMRKKRTGSSKLPNFVTEKNKPRSSILRNKRQLQGASDRSTSNHDKPSGQSVKKSAGENLSFWKWISGMLFVCLAVIYLWKLIVSNNISFIAKK